MSVSLYQVCAVVGGMATEKQERILRQRPSIVVATPGRLWKLMSEVHIFLDVIMVL